MSENRNSGKRPSKAAFLFMPQFGRCFESMSHVIPVFMRTLALMFAQADLIPRDHPALRYGAYGVPRSTFPDLMATAWTTLRRGRATPYQWGAYISVLLLCFTVVGGLVRTVAVSVLGIGREARAQLYSLASGPTDMTTITPIANPLDPFDFSYVNCGGTGPACTGHDDFGIMLLDKVLRQGTYHIGGYLQDGMQAMMTTYNTGILVVAGFMLLWAVLAVVVDTAKTGTIGGGRHNMVWAPIRIVFALGLLMPLSTANCTATATVCGFSSGQLMVEKLAEWGSDFGTNVWQSYLKGAENQALTGPVNIDNITPDIMKYANMWLCRVFINSYNYQATETETGSAAAPNEQTVVRVRKEGIFGVTPTWSYSFANKANANLCGTVTLEWPAGDAVALSAFAAYTPNVSPWTTAQQVFKDDIIGVWNGTTNTWNTTNTSYSWARLFDDNRGGTYPDELVMDEYARAWACDMAMHFIIGVDAAGAAGPAAAGNSPLVLSGNCGTAVQPAIKETAANSGIVPGHDLGFCTLGGTGGASVNDKIGPFPDGTIYGATRTNCVENMAIEYSDVINQSVSDAQNALLTAFYKEIDTADRGWADMGSWYIKLTQVNSVLEWARHPKIKIHPGDMVYTDLAREKTSSTSTATLDAELLKAMNKSNEWWKQESDQAGSTPSAPASYINGCNPGGPLTGMPACPTATNPSGAAVYTAAPMAATSFKQISPMTISGSTSLDMQKTMLGFLAPGSEPMMMIEGVMDYVAGRSKSWIMDLMQPGANNTYPYTQLIQTGHSILMTGFGMTLGSAVVPMALAQLGGDATGSAGASIGAMVGGAIGGLMTTSASIMILAGVVLTYWLPLLPFIRVAFAAMGWIVSVFEAVVMMPIAALAHISTEGEGLAGRAQGAWVLWLNVLLRPALTAVGFVGGIMVFNGFIVYFNLAMRNAIVSNFAKGDALTNLIELLVVTVVYVGGMYTVANASFKLVDSIPNALMRWMPGGSQDVSFQDHSGQIGAMIQQGGQSMNNMTGQFNQMGQSGAGGIVQTFKDKENPGGPTGVH